MQSHRILSIDGVNITGELYLMYGKTELTLSKGTNGCLISKCRCKNVLYKILQIHYKWNDDTQLQNTNSIEYKLKRLWKYH